MAAAALLQDAGYVVREMHQAVAEAAQQYEATGPGPLKAAGVLLPAARPAQRVAMPGSLPSAPTLQELLNSAPLLEKDGL